MLPNPLSYDKWQSGQFLLNHRVEERWRITVTYSLLNYFWFVATHTLRAAPKNWHDALRRAMIGVCQPTLGHINQTARPISMHMIRRVMIDRRLFIVVKWALLAWYSLWCLGTSLENVGGKVERHRRVDGGAEGVGCGPCEEGSPRIRHYTLTACLALILI